MVQENVVSKFACRKTLKPSKISVVPNMNFSLYFYVLKIEQSGYIKTPLFLKQYKININGNYIKF